jgi:hypothetical protein
MTPRSKHWFTAFGLLIVLVGIGNTAPAAAAEPAAVLVRQGRPQALIVVDAAVMADDLPLKQLRALRFPEQRQELDRRTLRESVKDLTLYLEKMSGAKVDVNTGDLPPGDARLPILIGKRAEERWGPPAATFVYEQAFRIVVAPDAVGLIGESDLASSYAIYEVLDQLGCRWFLPGDLGEYAPPLPTITLPLGDVTRHPYTYYRGIWVADADFKRRNRLGGAALNAVLMLESYLTAADRAEHPEWLATVAGQPHPWRLKWSAPGLDQFIAQKIIDRHEKTGNPSFSLSPQGGDQVFDTSPQDQALDAGDFDLSVQQTAITDRLVHFANRVATLVNAKYPEVRFGMMVWSPYARPPVRETLHPSITPQIGPNTFNRHHPMTDDGDPNSREYRHAVEGWGQRVPAVSYYLYGWLLAETSAPNPMIRKWSLDLPYIYRHGACRYWQPQTTGNFEVAGQALYLSIRLAWNPDQDPAAVIADFHHKLYGAMAKPLADYWSFIDACWYDTPEYAGACFGHLRRWTPQRLAQARRLLDLARAAAATDREQALAAMYDRSLALFERYMQMMRDLSEGRFEHLQAQSEAYLADMTAALAQYQNQYAFGNAPGYGAQGANSHYFRALHLSTYSDAARIAVQGQILTPALRQWQWKKGTPNSSTSADAILQDDNVSPPDSDGADWQTTDVAVDTWSALGLHQYFGSVWYRRTVSLPAELPAGKKLFLWIGATDGSARVWVNGHSAPYLKPVLDAQRQPTGESTRETQGEGFCEPMSFDITAAAKPGDNQVTILCRRTTLNEIGTGGLLAAPIVYAK